MYLGTNLTPKEYYQTKSDTYYNSHTWGIRLILGEIIKRYPSMMYDRIIDLGCGDGLVTKTLSGLGMKGPFIGLDSSAQMISRYKTETGYPARQQEFWQEMPQADIAIASYSLHLSPQSRLAVCGAWLLNSSIKKLLIISPIKRPKTIPGFETTQELYWNVGPDKSRIYLYVCEPK
jgi:hypothetical protein